MAQFKLNKSERFIYSKTFHNDIKVFKKHFISSNEYWLKRFINEQRFYTKHYPKLCKTIDIPIPLEINPAKSLSLEYIDGIPLAGNRYGDNDILNSELVEKLLSNLKIISALEQEEALEIIFDKSYLLSEITKAKALSVFKAEMLENIEQELIKSNFDLVPSHGDFLLRNIIQRNSNLFIIDWEYFGKNVYYWDHAILWCQLIGKKQLQDKVLTEISPNSKFIFFLTVITIIIKEIRLDLKTNKKKFVKTLTEIRQ